MEKFVAGAIGGIFVGAFAVEIVHRVRDRRLERLEEQEMYEEDDSSELEQADTGEEFHCEELEEQKIPFEGETADSSSEQVSEAT